MSASSRLNSANTGTVDGAIFVLEQAISLHRNGRLAEAESLYRKILSQNPHDADALGFLGLIEIQRKNLGAGIGLIDRAIRINPNNAGFFINRGNALRDLGRFDEALLSFDRAIALDPRFAEAHHNRGNVLRDLKRFDEAILSFDGALEVRPEFAEAHYGRGNALLGLKRLEEALLNFDHALDLRPDYADALNNRGLVLRNLRRFDDALASFDRALAMKPGNPVVLNNRGNALQDLRRYEEALSNFDEALALDPTSVEALNGRGVVLQDLRRFDEALICFDRALAIAPNYIEALNNRGNVLSQLKWFEEGLISIDRALQNRPDYAEALNNRGTALRGLKRLEEALISIDRALQLKPGGVEALNNRGVTLLDLERLDEALAALDSAIALENDRAELFNNRGNVLLKQRHPEAALLSFERAVALKPGYADALFGRGLCRLRLGDLKGGWSDYEHRWQAMEHAFSRRVDNVRDWEGESLAGRSILIYSEQGYGDMIQFARYLPLLAERGARVTFLVPERLFGILKGLSRPIRLIASVGPDDRFDFQFALMSLPLRLGTDLDTLPSSVPYLVAGPQRAADWRAKLGSSGFKIGIAWQGAPRGDGRPVPLRAFYPLSQIPNVRLISLQKNSGVEQLAELPSGMAVETLGEEFDAGPDAFIDTAAVMEQLDLIVTCDTSIPHLSGALARPTWVALKWAAEWRWMMDRADSPWYPTMRLFRQKTPGDWGGVFQDIAAAVENAVVAARAPIQIGSTTKLSGGKP